MIDILFMLEYCFDELEWKLLTCWSILAKNYIISLEKMYVYHWFTSYCIYSTVNSFYVDFQKKLKIHAALQVLYWQYCIQPREFLIFLITNNPPPPPKKEVSILLQQYCCNSTVASVLLQQYWYFFFWWWWGVISN